MPSVTLKRRPHENLGRLEYSQKETSKGQELEHMDKVQKEKLFKAYIAKTCEPTKSAT